MQEVLKEILRFPVGDPIWAILIRNTPDAAMRTTSINDAGVAFLAENREEIESKIAEFEKGNPGQKTDPAMMGEFQDMLRALRYIYPEQIMSNLRSIGIPEEDRSAIFKQLAEMRRLSVNDEVRILEALSEKGYTIEGLEKTVKALSAKVSEKKHTRAVMKTLLRTIVIFSTSVTVASSLMIIPAWIGESLSLLYAMACMGVAALPFLLTTDFNKLAKDFMAFHGNEYTVNATTEEKAKQILKSELGTWYRLQAQENIYQLSSVMDRLRLTRVNDTTFRVELNTQDNAMISSLTPDQIYANFQSLADTPSGTIRLIIFNELKTYITMTRKKSIDIEDFFQHIINVRKLNLPAYVQATAEEKWLRTDELRTNNPIEESLLARTFLIVSLGRLLEDGLIRDDFMIYDDVFALSLLVETLVGGELRYGVRSLADYQSSNVVDNYYKNLLTDHVRSNGGGRKYYRISYINRDGQGSFVEGRVKSVQESGLIATVTIATNEGDKTLRLISGGYLFDSSVDGYNFTISDAAMIIQPFVTGLGAWNRFKAWLLNNGRIILTIGALSVSGQGNVLGADDAAKVGDKVEERAPEEGVSFGVNKEGVVESKSWFFYPQVDYIKEYQSIVEKIAKLRKNNVLKPSTVAAGHIIGNDGETLETVFAQYFKLGPDKRPEFERLNSSMGWNDPLKAGDIVIVPGVVNAYFQFPRAGLGILEDALTTAELDEVKEALKRNYKNVNFAHPLKDGYSKFFFSLILSESTRDALRKALIGEKGESELSVQIDVAGGKTPNEIAKIFGFNLPYQRERFFAANAIPETRANSPLTGESVALVLPGYSMREMTFPKGVRVIQQLSLMFPSKSLQQVVDLIEVMNPGFVLSEEDPELSKDKVIQVMLPLRLDNILNFFERLTGGDESDLNEDPILEFQEKPIPPVDPDNAMIGSKALKSALVAIIFSATVLEAGTSKPQVRKPLRIPAWVSPSSTNNVKVRPPQRSRVQSNSSTPLGGIDLNAANADIQIKRDGNGVPLPLSQQNMEMLMKIDGFVPVIIDIRPIIDLPLFGQLKNQFTSASSNAMVSAS